MIVLRNEQGVCRSAVPFMPAHHSRAVDHAVGSYGFLVEENEVITAGEFARRIAEYYSPSARHNYIIETLERYDHVDQEAR